MEELVTAPSVVTPWNVHEVYVRRYQEMVRLASHLLLDPVAGEDIAQEAFALLYRRAMGGGKTVDNPEAYLRTTVVNLCRSAGRRLRLFQRRAPGLLKRASEHPDSSDAQAQKDVVLAGLRQLPLRQRQCLVLRYYADLSEADVARAMGISPGSVKTHTSRGLAALAQYLKESG